MKVKKDSKESVELVIARAITEPTCTNDKANEIFNDNEAQTNVYLYPKPKTYNYPSDNRCLEKPTETLPDKPHNTAIAGVEKPKKPRRHTRGAITQDIAAKLCGVSTRTIQNWEKGKKTPEGYPGRTFKDSFLIWLQGYEGHKGLLAEARSIKRACSVDPAKLDLIADESDRDWTHE